jgi:RNA polymerase sigma-70 factor (ECF subfamily)
VEEWGRDERELVRRCKEGSEAAYAVLVRLHRPRLYTLAYRLLLDREAAEDVVQETFLAAFRQMERFEPRPSLAAWLNTIALRTAGRAAARQRSRPRTSLDAPAVHSDGHEPASTAWSGDHLALAATDPATDPIAAAESADLRRELAAAIAALPFKYRAAVVVRHVLGLDYAEAARALDIPLNTFKSNLLRGTKMLREALAAQLDAAAAGDAADAAAADGATGGRQAVGRPAVAVTTPTTRTSAGRSTAERASVERQTPDHPAPERIARG